LNWVPLFNTIANALNTYQAFNRQSEISDFFFGAYGYVSFNRIYGTDGSLITKFDAQNIYNINNFVSNCISRPVNYYNDLLIIPATSQYTSALLSTDLGTINNSTTVETSLIANLSTLGRTPIQSLQVTMLFSNIQPTGSVNKETIRDLFFVDLHWFNVYLNLNVGTLISPI
jgi:hypothetical protein